MTPIIIVIVLQVVILAFLFLIFKKEHTVNFDEVTNLIRSQKDDMTETLFRNNNQLAENFSNLREIVVERLMETKGALNKDMFSFKDQLTQDLEKKFDKTNHAIQEKLEKINNKVQENLNEGFKKTNETFTGIIARLAKIDEAQKKIESLSTNVVSLQEVLTDKKSRGIFGEVQLTSLLKSVFGEGDKYYKLQFKLSNDKLVDAMLDLPEPIGRLCVDSKFPLENFKRMFEGSVEEKTVARREFVKNVKKHIDDISSKYIIKGETSEQAVLFLPAEAIFAEIHAYHEDIIAYSQKKNVWIASPTTFMATLTTVQSVLMNMERSKYMSILHEEINKLGVDFGLYEKRWGDLTKHLATVTKDVNNINITTGKISKRFQRIMEVEIDKGQTPEVEFSSQESLNDL
ncbi:DNA recombination protein RmuC [Halobacteriovorax sp. XZX-3]|uniref:DNA recombination protein RmuC n=1 Tax=unclassified Halobacteriovorax TaxID=2639665 RepID=UPI000CD1A410|nr:DNA recombination protein RmuC [Halobacteriovorax sp. DA5]POB15294.1 DNA recombination protein RmuC [Halobacteriovorax sp. DA5]